MLTYMEVHLYFTLPVLGLLYWVLRPFQSKSDGFKYRFLVAMAVSTASVWDNYIVYHKAWSYCPTCVVAVIGYVPLEEYMFFVIMTLMTVAFTNLVMRWRLPSTFIEPRTSLVQTIGVRALPILGLLWVAVKAWRAAWPAQRLFYGGCILWYTCPVLALLWYGGGEYILRRPISVLISIGVPTLFLCWVDKVAIRAGVWHISLRTSTGYFVCADLPLEECMFFALINTVLVFATCTLDRVQSIRHLFYSRHGFWQGIALAFLMPDQALEDTVLRDLGVTWDILARASQSFHTASSAFSYEVRQDLGTLYGFCRATDDLCDNENVPLDTRKRQLAWTREGIERMFSGKEPGWERYPLPEDCLCAFRAFGRLASYLEKEAVFELLEGYRWDLERRVVQSEADLAFYSACVASSVGEMCTRLMWSHEGQGPRPAWILERARAMGLVLQYVNMARDIRTDSETLGRVYLPQDWLKSNEFTQLGQGQASALGDARLCSLAGQLTQKAWAIQAQAKHGIPQLPLGCQGGVRAACEVYSAIGHLLDRTDHYPIRAHLSPSKRALVALQSIYAPS
ncbi:phytoene synthase [Sporodiniella umbellata]|nr:phytoene synthase [Sporodiniella umbellata]